MADDWSEHRQYLCVDREPGAARRAAAVLVRRGRAADPALRIGGKFRMRKAARRVIRPRGLVCYAAFSSKVFAFPSSSSRVS